MKALSTLILLSLISIGFSEEKPPRADSEVQELLLEPLDSTRDRTVPVKVYRTKSSKPQPVVLFSHGLGGSREASPYLGTHWAKHGYIAVFMQHPGSDESIWKNAKPGERMSAFQKGANPSAAVDRLKDVPFILDQLEIWNASSDHPLKGTLDLERIGLSGHSFGAATTMGMAGRKFPMGLSAYDERIDAFLPMSPNVGKQGRAKEQFGHLEVPIFCMTGTKDGSPLQSNFDPAVRREVYAAFPKGDKYQLVLEGATHSAFGGGKGKSRFRNPNHHPVIQELSTRFWDAYLKQDTEAKAWLQSTSPTQLEGMDEKDVWEWK